MAYYNAWFSGAFSQPYEKNRFPKYDSHAPKRDLAPSQRQDWRTIKHMVELWNAAAGGDVRQ
ncbi:MAG: hypothetical protein AAF468_12610 [Pseudomonadota bacterium]